MWRDGNDDYMDMQQMAPGYLQACISLINKNIAGFSSLAHHFTLNHRK